MGLSQVVTNLAASLSYKVCKYWMHNIMKNIGFIDAAECVLRVLIYKRVTNQLIASGTHCFYWLKYSPAIEWE